MKLAVQVVLEMRFDSTPDGRIWSPTTNTYDFWQRYLAVFDDVTVVARVRPVAVVQAEAKRADGPGVSFVPVPHYIGPAEFLRESLNIIRTFRQTMGLESAVIYRIPSLLAEIAANGRTGRRFPFGVEVVGDPFDVFAPDVVKHPLRPFFRWFFTRHVRRFCRQAATVAYVNETILRKRYPPGDSSITSSYSSIELPEEAFRLPQTVIVEQDRKRILFVGSLEQMYKGADVLIEAVGHCLKRGFDVEATIVGAGRYKQQLLQQARQQNLSNRVHFLGQLPAGEAIRRKIDASDLFVLPARTEGLPRVMIEAMARAKPCIGTTVGGIPELLLPEDLVPPNNPKALAGKIIKVLRDPFRMQAMGARNFKNAWAYRKEALDIKRRTLYAQLRSRTEAWIAKHGG